MLDRTTQSTLGRVTALVEQILERNGRSATIASGDRLVDAGLTSVDMVNLMLALETEFDVMIPPGDITPANFRSIASVEAMMNRVCEAKAA